MTVVSLKPELRTAGGETVSIYCDDDWAGDVYLVYREGDLLTGTVQIDTGKVSERNLEYVMDEVRTYISHLAAALNITTSSVVMMHGDIEQILEMEPIDTTDNINHVQLDGTYEHDLYAEETDEQLHMGSYDDNDDDAEEDYHLSLFSDEGDHVKYHLYDDFHNVIGMVSVDEIGETVSGRVDFWVEPDKDEPEEVAQVLFQAFRDEDVNQISFTMNYEDRHIADMYLEHRDYS
ncbi:hypothetical protein [Effusibacillus lacus]|uniref:Uncharacterized protein n=1 Tax=Effusibacillus lacus TaxID=1348429 RepID=A0A292YQN5_9BACL|nr:hypothetical protein [Effusibacillus lacus]TCS68934.1 hypothetical protein EDD64_1394 [Effusibacillus lacus]GAX91496.1 hypothetical protein EFBL_3165 [Effusibacillus lacus]